MHSKVNINLFDDATIGDRDFFNNCEAIDYSKSKIIFAHLEELLSDVGKTLMKSNVFENNVFALCDRRSAFIVLKCGKYLYICSILLTYIQSKNTKKFENMVKHD